jgi:hypothetical protein
MPLPILGAVDCPAAKAKGALMQTCGLRRCVCVRQGGTPPAPPIEARTHGDLPPIREDHQPQFWPQRNLDHRSLRDQGIDLSLGWFREDVSASARSWSRSLLGDLNDVSGPMAASRRFRDR